MGLPAGTLECQNGLLDEIGSQLFRECRREIDITLNCSIK
jgi:hypothetical protein